MIESKLRWLSSWPVLLGATAITVTGSWYGSLDISKLSIANLTIWQVALLGPIVIGVVALLAMSVIDMIKADFSLSSWFSGRHFVVYVAFLFLFDHHVSDPIFMFLAIVSFLALIGRLMESDIPEAVVFRPDVLSKTDNVEKVVSTLIESDFGVYCGDVQAQNNSRSLYVSSEDRGIVIGPPGTGKTAFMVSQLLDWAERRNSFVCLDIKPELHDIMKARLDALGFRSIVFNPSRPKDRYNLFDDLSGITALGELAASLVPSSDADSRAFDEGARDVLDGVMSYLKAEGRTISLPVIREFLASFASEKELIRALSESSDTDVREIAFALSRSGQNARFMGSVFATLRANLRFLRYDDIRRSIEDSDFSLNLFLEDRPVALFLQFEERYQETTSLLLAAMISHLFNFFIEHTERDPVLLMLDEVGNVPRIPGLVEKLNTIRSRKLPTWMYWQGIQQMQKYGRQANEGPSSIMAACDFQTAFRLNDNDTARWFSERIGTVDRQTVSTDSSMRDSYQAHEEPILKVADLQSLPVGESVALYRGQTWRNKATPYFVRWPEMARS